MCANCVTSGIPEALGIAAIGARAWWVSYTNRRDLRRHPELGEALEALEAADDPGALLGDDEPTSPLVVDVVREPVPAATSP